MNTYKMSRKIIIIMLLVVLIGFVLPQAIFAEDEVKFECDNLKATLVDIIGHEEITIEDMHKLDGALDLSYQNISCIEGLEHLTNVEDLILSNNSISDIVPIMNLQNLESLYVNDNWLQTLPDTSNLISLEHLDISNNEIKIIPLGFIDMPALRRLYMENLTLIVTPDLSSVADTLDRLDITGWRLDDYSFVSHLINLELLMLNDCSMRKLPDLSALHNLEYLYLTSNQLTTLPDYLGYLPLIRLDFSSNAISRLPESYANLTKLEQLVMTDNYFTTLPELVTKLYRLEVLMCGQNIISEVPENISDLENVKRASFASNQLQSLYQF
ncbi:MAG: hypothetical protein KAQ68_05285, partial [Clostridiales bacterium]|nr:hypothetical protein [Clostridiales bacterium]